MIVVNLDVMMAKRKMSLSQLSEKVDITLANLSILKNNKAKAVRFSTLEAICAAWTASRETFWSSCRTKRRNHDRQAHGSAPPKAGLHLPSPHFPCWRRSSSRPRSSAPPGREWYWSSCWGGSLCPSAPGISGNPPLEPGRSRKMGPSVLRDIFCGLYPAAVSLPICPGRPPGPLRYLITPFRILLLMLTR